MQDYTKEVEIRQLPPLKVHNKSIPLIKKHKETANKYKNSHNWRDIQFTQERSIHPLIREMMTTKTNTKTK